MVQKKKIWAGVVEQEQLAPGIFDLWLETDLALEAKAGQFVGLYPADKSTLLPRPISICEADKEKGRLRLVYRVAGQGTREFSHLKPEEQIGLLGILGNGFPVEEGKGKRAFLIGGGIGIPPMLQLAKELKATSQILLGYRDSRLFLQEDLSLYGEVFVATEDGSLGTKGNVIDAIGAEGVTGDVIYSCGPTPMLRGVKVWGMEANIPAWILRYIHAFR